MTEPFLDLPDVRAVVQVVAGKCFAQPVQFKFAANSVLFAILFLARPDAEAIAAV
jgi:hypothetical protein